MGGGSGGNGADGQDGLTYGSGGDGGSGGGGAGVCGALKVTTHTKTQWERRSGSTATSYGLSAVARATAYAASNIRGGSGGKKGNGVQGCIILYYGVPQKIVSGPVKDKNGRVVLDKLGRRLIV